MREILPGLFHWRVIHDRIGIPVHSYYLSRDGVLIDPTVPEEGLDWFRGRGRGRPEHVVLTNRHHYRHSGRYVEAYGVDVRCHRAGLHEFTKGEKVEPFEHGDVLPGRIVALEVGVLCPEETALLFESPEGRGGVVAFGDALIRGGRGGLGFVPEEYMGPDPRAVKRGLRLVFRHLLAADFEHLLFAHGAPIVSEGKKALRQFLRMRAVVSGSRKAASRSRPGKTRRGARTSRTAVRSRAGGKSRTRGASRGASKSPTRARPRAGGTSRTGARSRAGGKTGAGPRTPGRPRR